MSPYPILFVSPDDLIIAPDFYMYFSALLPILNSDPTIMCVSAYADNGKRGYINPQQSGPYIPLHHYNYMAVHVRCMYRRTVVPDGLFPWPWVDAQQEVVARVKAKMASHVCFRHVLST